MPTDYRRGKQYAIVFREQDQATIKALERRHRGKNTADFLRAGLKALKMLGKKTSEKLLENGDLH